MHMYHSSEISTAGGSRNEIFEIKDNKVNEIITDLSYIMSSIITLSIPLEVSVCVGKSWGELK